MGHSFLEIVCSLAACETTISPHKLFLGLQASARHAQEQIKPYANANAMVQKCLSSLNE